MTAPRILVVDDDDDLRTLISDFLVLNGLFVESAANASQMDAKLHAGSYDVIVLDLMMPGEDGLSVIKRMRGPDRPGVIVLSAIGTDVDRIVGLEMGADDYIAKPCNPRELLARVRALLRRNSSPVPAGPVRIFGSWTLSLVQRTVTRAGETVALTDAEFRVLTAFLNHPQVLLTRDQLIELAKGYEAIVIDRAIDVTISRLRKKLGPTAPIRTARNEGYIFTLSVET